MRKDTIELKVSNQKTMRISAYLTDEPKGLAIHRAVQWVPAKNEHKHVSKWTLTHVASGLSLLMPSDYFTTMARCKALAKELSHIDWVESETDELRTFSRDVREAINKIKDTVKLPSEEEEKEAPRYTIRRARGVGYEVVDTSTDAVVESFAHRGLAGGYAKELNGKESL